MKNNPNLVPLTILFTACYQVPSQGILGHDKTYGVDTSA